MYPDLRIFTISEFCIRKIEVSYRALTLFSSLQGLMFGYATDETEECMPLTVVLAHKLNQKIAELRRSGELWWARPDTKTQVKLLTFVASYSS